MLNENKSNSLETRVKLLELKEAKKDKKEYENKSLGLISLELLLVFCCIPITLIKVENGIEKLLLVGIFTLILLVCVYYFLKYYPKYQKKKKQIEKLEQELKRLKEGLKEAKG